MVSEAQGYSKYGLALGEVVESKRCGSFIILGFGSLNTEVFIRFLETGTELQVSAGSIRNRGVRDKNYPTFFGKGCLGFGEYKTRHGKGKKTPAYQKWENMLARCYYPKTARYSAYGGVGVEVCEEWLNFQVFAEWFYKNYREGYHLDKDILGDGKIYNPEVCRFIPQEVNGLLVNNTINTGKLYNLPAGVSYDKRTDVYQCTLNVTRTGGVRFYSKNIEDVKNYYIKEKTRLVREVVEKYKHSLPEDIYDKLCNYTFTYEEELL